MASAGSTHALIQRRQNDLSRMPPPPTKRIKRPAEVLDEDEYTNALSDIIAREFFPGLQEAKAQEEYLHAQESGNASWIREAEQKLREAATSQTIQKARRVTRDSRFDTSRLYQNAADTPRGFTGSETPVTVAESEDSENIEEKKRDYTGVSLSAFQTKYTSEDNESFNSLLDKQNTKRRQKHSYLWTSDQRILSQRQITHRAAQDKLLKEKAEYEETNGKELIPLAIGATSDRPAKPDNWKQKRPNNSFMFNPDSVDEEGLSTIMDAKEAASKAGPKQIVHENTRFPPLHDYQERSINEPSPSIHTSVIARCLNPSGSIIETESEYSGSETPRVNGYAFVDEDEPDTLPQPPGEEEPTYRDLLAGQVGDKTPNPFRINQNLKREALHHRIVERDAAKKRAKEKEVVRGVGASTPAGNMTPAARKLMEKLGKTPGRQTSVQAKGKDKEMWTPTATPRRKVV